MTISWTRNVNGTGTTIHDTDDAVSRVLGLLRQTDMTGDRKVLAESIVTAVDLARRPTVATRYEVVDRTDRQAMADWRAGSACCAPAVDDTMCAECGWTYTGTYCDVCTPCDDCGRAQAACLCEGYSVDTDDLYDR